jgi:regulator of protease activity HflC (stomatin/prohibitin superfamily)
LIYGFSCIANSNHLLEWVNDSRGELVGEIIGGIIVLTIMILLSGFKVVKDHERIVLFRLGKVAGSRGSGLQLVIPILEKFQIVDTRIVTLAIPLIETPTLDNLPIRVSAVCLYKIVDATKAVSSISDCAKATAEIAQTTLRSTIAHHDLRYLMHDRKRFGALVRKNLEKKTKHWGVGIVTVEIKELKITREAKKTLHKARRQKLEGEQHAPFRIGLEQHDSMISRF